MKTTESLACECVHAPFPEELEKAWIMARFPASTVAVISRPGGGRMEASAWYCGLARRAGRAETETIACPMVALEFGCMAEAEAFARSAAHSFVTLYRNGEEVGLYAGGEPV